MTEPPVIPTPAAPSASGALPRSQRVVVRISASLVANVIAWGVGSLTGVLVARGLGPRGYGDLAFLLATFAALGSTLDLGTSTGFYTFISRGRRGYAVFAVYGAWLGFQILVTVLLLAVVLPDHAIRVLFVGQRRDVVVLAFGAALLSRQGWALLSQLGEAARRTVWTQAVNAGQTLLHFALVVALLRWGSLRATTIMWLLVGEYTAILVAFVPRLVRLNVGTTRESPRDVIREFRTYSAPLAAFGVLGVAYGFWDRWLLQRVAGPIEQGFFGIAQQFTVVSLLATMSAMQVFWKETADATARGDEPRRHTLYTTFTRGLFAVGAVVSCAVIPYTREILRLTVGARFESAWVAVAIMLLYPVYQALGQIQGAHMYAAGQTRRYAALSGAVMLAGLPLTYVLIAAQRAPIPGLGLGSTGLALKTVLVAIISVNLLGWSIARSSAWRSEWRHQVTTLPVLLGAGFATRWLASLVLADPAARACVGLVLYSALVVTIVARIPRLLGLEETKDILWRAIRAGVAK